MSQSHGLMTNTRPPKPPYPRHRESGSFTGGLSFYRSYSIPNGTSSNANFASGEKKVCDDVVTPGFKERSAAGEVIMSPLRSTHQVKSSQAISLGNGYFGGNPANYWRYETGPDTRWALGLSSVDSILGAVPSLHSGSDVDNLCVEASTRCLSQIGRASTDSWENVAETRSTVGMVWDPLRRWWAFEQKVAPIGYGESVERWAKRMRKLGLGKFLRVSAIKNLSLSANLWLMYRYGLRPLIGSISDILKALEENNPERRTTRAEAISSLTSTTTWNRVDSGTFANRKTITESVQVRAMSLDEASSEWAYDRGFSSKSLLTLPWELIPYSFVADWFVNVGDLIGALAQSFYPASLGQCLTTRYVQSAVQSNSSHVGSGYTVTAPLLALVREDCVTTVRVLGLRTPGIVVKSNFKLDDITRAGDAIALVGQQLLKRLH